MRRWLPRETEATTASRTAEIGSMAIAADLRVRLIDTAQGCEIAAGDHERATCRPCRPTRRLRRSPASVKLP